MLLASSRRLRVQRSHNDVLRRFGEPVLPLPGGMTRLASLVLATFLGAHLSCASDPNAGNFRVVVGADGLRWMVIECDEKPDCWRAAGRRCPAGYFTSKEGSDVSSNVATQKISTSTAMMIRCKAGAPATDQN